MRNQKRIGIILKYFTQYWLDHPDLRFGQAVTGFIHFIELSVPINLFLLEDIHILQQLSDIYLENSDNIEIKEIIKHYWSN